MAALRHVRLCVLRDFPAEVLLQRSEVPLALLHLLADPHWDPHTAERTDRHALVRSVRPHALRCLRHWLCALAATRRRAAEPALLACANAAVPPASEEGGEARGEPLPLHPSAPDAMQEGAAAQSAVPPAAAAEAVACAAAPYLCDPRCRLPALAALSAALPLLLSQAAHVRALTAPPAVRSEHVSTADAARLSRVLAALSGAVAAVRPQLQAALRDARTQAPAATAADASHLLCLAALLCRAIALLPPSLLRPGEGDGEGEGAPVRVPEPLRWLIARGVLSARLSVTLPPALRAALADRVRTLCPALAVAREVAGGVLAVADSLSLQAHGVTAALRAAAGSVAGDGVLEAALLSPARELLRLVHTPDASRAVALFPALADLLAPALVAAAACSAAAAAAAAPASSVAATPEPQAPLVALLLHPAPGVAATTLRAIADALAPARHTPAAAPALPQPLRLALASCLWRCGAASAAILVPPAARDADTVRLPLLPVTAASAQRCPCVAQDSVLRLVEAAASTSQLFAHHPRTALAVAPSLAATHALGTATLAWRGVMQRTQRGEAARQEEATAAERVVAGLELIGQAMLRASAGSAAHR